MLTDSNVHRESPPGSALHLTSGTLYFDHNATTRPAPEVLEAMREVEETAWANPSSVHRLGQAARYRLERAREQVAGLLGTASRSVIFTSGGTEANDLALWGVLEGPAAAGRRRVLITSAAEHPAVGEAAEALAAAGVQWVALPVDGVGRIDPAALEAALAEHATPETAVLVSLIGAHNETGAIQPMEAVAAVVQARRKALREQGHRPRLWLHSDGTQAVGKRPVDFRASGLDLLTASAHKLHGPKGVGALGVRAGGPLAPRHRGGPQEGQRRGGTEPVAAIAGFGAACELAQALLADPGRLRALGQMRDALEAGVVEGTGEAVLHGAGLGPEARLWNTASIGFPRFEAEGLLVALSERGLCASAGSACSSGSLEPSPALKAMGLDPALAHGTLRFSLGRENTREEVREAVNIVTEAVARLRRSMPAGPPGEHPAPS